MEITFIPHWQQVIESFLMNTSDYTDRTRDFSSNVFKSDTVYWLNMFLRFFFKYRFESVLAAEKLALRCSQYVLHGSIWAGPRGPINNHSHVNGRNFFVGFEGLKLFLQLSRFDSCSRWRSWRGPTWNNPPSACPTRGIRKEVFSQIATNLVYRYFSRETLPILFTENSFANHCS